jgi:WD40 repeat protein
MKLAGYAYAQAVANQEAVERTPPQLRGTAEAAVREAHTLKWHNGGVHSVAFSPDGKRLASGSGDKSVKVWDAQTGQELLTLKRHGDVTGVAFSPDGHRLAAGTANGTVTIWDATPLPERP